MILTFVCVSTDLGLGVRNVVFGLFSMIIGFLASFSTFLAESMSVCRRKKKCDDVL